MNAPNDIVTTKRTINHRTKQIETRIQRQIVIEDGKVVSDTGPLVTTKTLEDSKQEIDEVEEKYEFAAGGKEKLSSRSTDKSEASTVKSPELIKTFMFGYDDQGSSSSSKKSENKNSGPTWNKPTSKYYFGQPIDNENVKKDLKLHMKKTSANKSSNERNVDEQDCQFVYEYSDFSHAGNERNKLV